MLFLAAPVLANPDQPSQQFLEYLAEEEQQSWMVSVLEASSTQPADMSDQEADHEAE